ncbi:MAG TPA: hypothetical protein VEP49_19305 [Acidimicrobiia bacterium]|nr:hypothetical protein [Acidimicrobiia bacterium]
MRGGTVRLVLGCSLAVGAVLVSPVTASSAPAAKSTLVPAPGTGHGVLGGAPPSEELGSLEYGPGLGAACPARPQQVEVTPLTYGAGGVVSLPVSLCIGRFPAPTMQVTITPPRGGAIVLRNQSIPSGLPGASIDILVLPSPPDTRYRVVDSRNHVSTGRLPGSGAGTYRVRVTGGTAAVRTSFTLAPPPTPRLVNLTTMDATVKPPGRLQFGAAGEPPLQTFEVGIFGPFDPSADTAALPLRSVVVARADRGGEAVVTLDVLATSIPGDGYVAVLDPKTPLADPNALDPRVAMFEVRRT